MDDNSYKISLGVKVDTSDIQSQINADTQNLKPIQIKVEIGNIEEIKKQIQNLGGAKNNTKSSLSIDTTSLESSLKDVSQSIKEIKSSIGTLDSKSGMKSLLSSINQISAALDKASSQFKDLNLQLDALSKKDFSFNFNFKTGNSNPVKANIDYGKEARRNAIPALQEQASALQNLIGGYDKADRALSNYLTKIYKANGVKIKNNLIDDMADTSNISKQMEAIEQYIGYLRKISLEKGIDLSSFDAQFSKSANEIVDDTHKIQSGAKQTEESLEQMGNELKKVFGSGIDAEKLSVQLDSIVSDLSKIREAIQGLSSVLSIDGITQDFNKMSEASERAVNSATDFKNALNGASSGISEASNTANGFKEIDIAIGNAENEISNLEVALRRLGVSDNNISEIDKELKNLGVSVKNVTATLHDDGSIDLKVKGVDSLERAVTLMKNIDAEGIMNGLGDTFSQDFKETENAFKRLKSLAKEIGDIEFKIAGLDADKNKGEITELTSQLNKLQSEYRELYDITERNLLDNQINELAQSAQSAADKVSVLNAKMSDSSAAKELKRDFEELAAVANKIDKINLEIGKLDGKSNSNEISFLTNQLKELEQTYQELRNKLQGKLLDVQLSSITSSAFEVENTLKRLDAQIADTRANLAKKIELKLESGKFDTQVQKIESNAKKLSITSKEVEIGINNVKQALNDMQTAKNRGDIEGLIDANKRYEKALESVKNQIEQNKIVQQDAAASQKLMDDRNGFISSIDAWMTKNSAAVKKFGSTLNDLKQQAKSCDAVQLNHLKAQFKEVDKAAESAGLKARTFGDALKDKLSQFSAYFSIASLFMYAEQGLRSMFEQVKAIDSAMTELKKVTDESASSYNKFLENSATTAKEVGTTIDGIITSTADFARLGYGFEDAQGLAKVANIYTVVGDEIDGVETATKSLISTLAAFKDEASGISDTDFAMDIVDKFNEVSNNFAISSGGIGEAMQRSASSLRAANNTIDESIALITAA